MYKIFGIQLLSSFRLRFLQMCPLFVFLDHAARLTSSWVPIGNIHWLGVVSCRAPSWFSGGNIRTLGVLACGTASWFACWDLLIELISHCVVICCHFSLFIVWVLLACCCTTVQCLEHKHGWQGRTDYWRETDPLPGIRDLARQGYRIIWQNIYKTKTKITMIIIPIFNGVQHDQLLVSTKI